MTTPTTQREADERAKFEAWIKTCSGYPFAGYFTNLIWAAWQARAATDQPSAGRVDKRTNFETLFATIHPSAQILAARLFERVVDDSRYCSLEVEYAWKTYCASLAPTAPQTAEEQLRRMRAAFHINMLRAFPGKTHAEIEAEIDKACDAAPQAASQQANDRQHMTHGDMLALCAANPVAASGLPLLAPQATSTASADPEGDFAKGMLIQLSRMGASPAALSLAVQLFGVGPCEKCGYRKLHCRCATETTTASASQSELLGSAQLSALVDMYRKGAVLEDLFQRAAALARAPLPAQNDADDTQVAVDAFVKWLEGRGALGPGALSERIFMAGWCAAKRHAAQPVQAVDVARDIGKLTQIAKAILSEANRGTSGRLILDRRTEELLREVYEAAQSHANAEKGPQ